MCPFSTASGLIIVKVRFVIIVFFCVANLLKGSDNSRIMTEF